MQTDYKFSRTERVQRAEVQVILTEFFDKKFEEFLKDKVLFFVSNELSNNGTILDLEFDFNKEESEEPNSEVMRTKGFLEEVFGIDKFNLEMTPKGCRLISNFFYGKTNTMDKTKTLLKPVLGRMRNLDLDLSFTTQPIPRVGFDPDKGFLYSPADETTEKLRNGLFGQSTSYLDDEYWKDYIVHNLIPVNGNRMSINELFKKLSLVDKLLAGEILDEDEIKEKEAKGGTETESKPAES